MTIDVKPTSELHRRIVTAVKSRRDLSKQKMRDRHAAWEKAEDEFLAYMPTKEADRLREKKRDGGEAQYTDIFIPHGYATLMAAHTYWSSVFLSRNPVFQMMGRHGEADMNVQAVEAYMEYQTTVGGMLPQLFVWLMDVGKYGIGVIGHYWEQEKHYVSEFVEEPVTFNGVPLVGQMKKRKLVKEINGYEGNRLFNVRPQDYLPDPRVPLTDPDKGEFVGRQLDLSLNDLVSGKLRGYYIKENVDHVVTYLSRLGNGKPSEGSARIVLPGADAPNNSTDVGSGLVSHVSCIEMVVEIIPRMWGLGKLEYPEKWVFLITDDTAGENVVLQARPLGLYHNKFPYRVIECEVDGYSLFKRSLLDVSRPINNILNWLFNSHFHNVRRSLNGEIVFDPSRVVASDVLDRNPGKRIRIKPEAYGQDVRTMLHVIQPDSGVTQTHMRDFQVVTELLQKITGVNDNSMGAIHSGGRKSATEIRSANGSALGRMKTQCEYFSATGFAPLASMLLQTSQQLYSTEQKFRIAGSLHNNIQEVVTVNADMLAGGYDYIPVDGTLPVDRMAQVNMWTMLLSQAQSSPQFMQQYDIAKMIAYVAQLGGIKNMKQFRVQVMDPEVIETMKARGQLENVAGPGQNIPSAGGAGLPSPSRSAEDLERNAGTVPDTAQLGGLGRTV